MDTATLAFLALAAFVAGFVDSIAGGGGLLALPALLLAGLDPVLALATNKLQGSFGTASASFAFWRKGHLHIADHWLTIATTFIAACLGVAAIKYAPTAVLTAALPRNGTTLSLSKNGGWSQLMEVVDFQWSLGSSS